MNYDLAYAAGLIDMQCRLDSYTDGKTPRLHLYLHCSQEHRHLVDWLRYHFGGHVRETWSTTKKTKRGLQWQITGEPCIELLRMIRPFSKRFSDEATLDMMARFDKQTHSLHQLRDFFKDKHENYKPENLA